MLSFQLLTVIISFTLSMFSGDAYDPTVEPTLEPTFNPTNNPTLSTTDPTVNPTMYPTIDPTYIPTVHPTMLPTFIPTLYPTINHCNGWKILLTFALLEYNHTNDQYWTNTLQQNCLSSFISTLVSKIADWNGKYCSIIDKFGLTTSQRRLLSVTDINIDISFIINDHLYTDYFLNHNVNISEFGIEFQQHLLQKLGNNESIDQFMIYEPINTITPSPVSKPVNVPKTENKYLKLIIMLGILGLFFICVCIGILSIIKKLFCKEKSPCACDKKYPTDDEVNIHKNISRPPPLQKDRSESTNINEFHNIPQKSPSTPGEVVARSQQVRRLIEIELETQTMNSNAKTLQTPERLDQYMVPSSSAKSEESEQGNDNLEIIFEHTTWDSEQQRENEKNDQDSLSEQP